MGLISEKQLREVRVKLFYIMDDVIINSEKGDRLSKEEIMELSLKVVGLSYDDILTQQLWAEYKTWQQIKDNTVKELRCYEKNSKPNI